MDDNDLFMLMDYHTNNSKKKTRIRGLYGCLFCGEFIKNIPKPVTSCPFCGREAKLIEKIDNFDYKLAIDIMKDGGYYSDERAGVRKEQVAI